MQNDKLTKHDQAIFAEAYTETVESKDPQFGYLGTGKTTSMPHVNIPPIAVDRQDVAPLLVKSSDPTRDAFHNLMAKINLAEAQSQLTGEALERFKRVSRKAINPDHYVSPAQKKAQKKTKFAVLDKTFGARKRVIYVEGKDGSPKPITIKNAKKQGLI